MHAYLRCILPNEVTINYLYLDGVHVSIDIVDVHAQVVLSQRFTNTFKTAVEANYTFAMLADAAVCGFEMVRGDGTKVIGKTMEKKAAKVAYEEAVSQGKTAGLGEEQTKDVFSIKVGNIQPQETVTINLTFLAPLIDDEKKDQIRFTFPRGYAMRYGSPPTPDASNAMGFKDSAQKLSIDVSIQQSNTIKSISCPSSHPIELSLGRPEGFAADSSISDSNFASVKLSTATAFLNQDFILVITSTGLDSPRCFIEPHSSPNEDTTAFGLTFVPRFTLPDVKDGMEYIFVVDRSGSMSGTPIDLVKEALVVLLRGLPTKSTTFNIFSFGSHANSLWSSSKDYTQSSLDEATRHVDKMQADYGGTEIAQALKLVFKSLPQKRTRPVSVFLLTDGGAWDVSTCEQLTRDTVQSPGAFVRVFTVGIGSGVSTNTVESIARAGEAMSIYVQENEPMTGKLARLVRAARTPAIKDIEVLWPKGQSADDDFELVDDSKSEQTLIAPESKPSTQPVNLFSSDDDKGDKDVGPPPKPEVKPEDITPPVVQQAPLTIRGLFPGTRTQMYAIVSSMQGKAPTSVRVRGKVATTGDVVELDVPVVKIMSTRTSLIHTLAARAIITDREDGKHVFASSVSSKSDLLAAHIEADIIRLGTKYGLTSRHTSYVAIDERDPKSVPKPHAPEPEAEEFEIQSSYLASGSRIKAKGLSQAAYAPRAMSALSAMPMSAPPPPPSGRQGAVRERSRGGFSGGMGPSPSLPPPGAYAAADISTVAERGERLDSLSSRSNELSAQSKMFAKSAKKSSSSVFGSIGGAVANKLSSMKRGGGHARASSGASLSSAASEDMDVSTPTGGTGISAVARLQKFDGGFTFNSQLFTALEISSETVKKTLSGIKVGDDVLATVVALVWMRKNAEDEAQDMIDKAEDWLKDNVSDATVLEELKTKAAQLV